MPSHYKRGGRSTHMRCRRCGLNTYHMQKKKCSHCGYPSPRLRKFAWQWKTVLSRIRKK